MFQNDPSHKIPQGCNVNWNLSTWYLPYCKSQHRWYIFFYLEGFFHAQLSLDVRPNKCFCSGVMISKKMAIKFGNFFVINIFFHFPPTPRPHSPSPTYLHREIRLLLYLTCKPPITLVYIFVVPSFQPLHIVNTSFCLHTLIN